jgi:hypothetical protein
VTENEADPAAGPSDDQAPEADPEAAPVTTLQEEFAELRPELGQSMLGKPAQLVTGLLIGALLLVGLLIGLTTLAKDGAVPLISPTPVVSPSASVGGGVLLFALTR